MKNSEKSRNNDKSRVQNIENLNARHSLFCPLILKQSKNPAFKNRQLYHTHIRVYTIDKVTQLDSQKENCMLKNYRGNILKIEQKFFVCLKKSILYMPWN